MEKLKDIKYSLSILTAILASCISLYSLVFQKVYSERFNSITSFELLGQDIVTAIISFLFFYVVLFKDYEKAGIKIIWSGCLIYFFYIYAYFSFGGVMSGFYLLYITLTGLSLYTFFAIMADVFNRNAFPIMLESYKRKSVSVFLFICIIIFYAIELSEIAAKTIINPEKMNPFYVFYVLDLSIIFPFILIASIFNFMKKPVGYFFAGIALMKVVTILPAVIFNDLFHWIYKGFFLDLNFDIIASIITAAGFIILVMFMRAVKE